MSDTKRCWNCAHFERTIARYGVRDCESPLQPPSHLNDYGNEYILATHALRERAFCGPDRKAWEPRQSGPVTAFFDQLLFGLRNADD